MKISAGLNNMIKGLAPHYLQGRSIQEAIEQGKQAGAPAELLNSLPGMMFEVTAAASAIFAGERRFHEMVGEVTRRAFKSGNTEEFSREDASTLITMTLAFIKELSANGGDQRPVPETNEPWFQYGLLGRPT